MEKKGSISIWIIKAIMIFFIFIVGAAHAYDSSQAPPGYSPQKGIKTAFQSIAAEGTPDILLIQTANPWDSDADTIVLDKLGNSYKVVDMSGVLDIDIDDYQVILIVNDQVQAFYDNYAENYDKFESYVKNGGTLVFFACDHGWAGGDNYTDLPGGVQVGDRCNDTNTISNNTHPIITQALTGHADAPLTNFDMDGTRCSHNYFVESTLPYGADIILRTDDDDAYPTLVVYSLGNGKVIASGLTWEFTYDRYVGAGQQYGFGRALPDVFKYAFSISGGHKTAGINVDIYPEDDSRGSGYRKDVYKAKGDLFDIVARITNNTDPNTEQADVSLKLSIENTGLNTDFLKVYKHASAEEIAVNPPEEIEQGTDPGQYSKTYNDGQLEITINGLTIPTESEQKWTEFVFRVKVADDASDGQTFDPAATVSGSDIETNSEKLSDSGATVEVISKGKIILTNRELMYKQFAKKNDVLDENGASQVKQLWEAVFDIAAEQRAVVYHIDKYDRDDDGDEKNNITIDWFEDRWDLDNDGSGSYEYDNDPETNTEETTINQVAIKVKGLLNDFITRSGGLGAGRYVAILGGDSIIPFYRVFDPSLYDFDDDGTKESDEHTVLYYNAHHNATTVTIVDAANNYLFTDIFYRDFNGLGWEEGTVENVFCGRITGITAQNIQALLESSNIEESMSNNVVKLENNKRDGELTVFHDLAEGLEYTVITTIGEVSIDVSEPLIIAKDDPARWENFEDLFTGDVNNAQDFDIMRFMCHGSVDNISSSENFYSEYFDGWDLWNNRNDIKNHFSSFYPFFIFDACLVGLMDGFGQGGLFNSLSSLDTRGIIGASGVSWTPMVSEFNDEFSLAFTSGVSAGASLCFADRWYGGNENLRTYTRYQMNLFGLPWATITPPNDRAANNAIQAYNEKNEKSTIQSIILGTNTKTIVVDTSNYSQTTSDIYDIVSIDGFDLLRINSSTPVVPKGRLFVNIPLNATIDSVTVDFSSPVDLGNLNIPAFQPPPPMPDPDGLMPSGGYVDSPTDLGIFPAEQYSYKTAEIIGYKQVLVDIYPLTFDTDSGQTILYSSANISITYTTPDQGLVMSFDSDQGTYAVGEEIVTAAGVENISASSNSFTITVDVLDLAGNVISSNKTSQSIDSNTSASITVNLTAPDTAGPYRLQMEASDGTNTIGSSQQEINVVEGQIVSFDTSSSINMGEYGTFTVEFENLSQTTVTAYENISIYNSSGEQVASLPQTACVIEAGITDSSATQWFPSESLPSGVYYAYVSVTVNSESYSKKSAAFDIISENDISLSSGWNLISLNFIPADTDIASVLSEISGKYLSVWAYINGAWQTYDMFNPGFSDLATMEPGYGYWINMAADGILSVNGTSPANDISLYTGWNLVGYNSSSSITITDALNSIAGKYIAVWAFINGEWKVYDPANAGFSDLTTMEPGYGYWINASEACTWTLP